MNPRAMKKAIAIIQIDAFPKPTIAFSIGTVFVKTVKAKAIIETPPIGSGRVIHAMIVATNKANICQPATGTAAGLIGVINHKIKPIITGQMNPL